MRAFLKVADTLGAFANKVVSENHPVEEDRQKRAEKAVHVSRETLRDAIVDIPGVFEDTVTALVTSEVYNGASGRKADYSLRYKASSTERSTKSQTPSSSKSTFSE